MTTTTRTRKPETKIVKLHQLGGANPVLGITKGSLTNFYTLESIPSELGGVAFQLSKAHDGSGKEPEVYHVLLHGRDTSCTCKGHSYCGRCKHVDALQALIAAGKIDATTPDQQPAPQVCEFDDP